MSVKVSERVRNLLNPGFRASSQIYDAPWIRLDRNESHFGISDRVHDVIAESERRLSSYPENTGVRLRQSLAKYYGVNPEQILIGNGSFELIWLIASVYLDSNRVSIFPTVTFGAYRKYSQLAGSQIKAVPLSEYDIDLSRITEAVVENTGVIWLCNPNNPTGHYISENKVRDFLKSVPSSILVVIDEAYIEFTDRYSAKDTVDFIREFPNVVLLRTFSKFYGLASLRLGYALSSETVIRNLMQFRIPPNHSRIAEEAARVSIEDTAFQLKVHRDVLQERAYVEAEFDRLGLKYTESEASFILFQIPEIPSKDILEIFRQSHLLLKDAGEFGFPDWIRITLGNHEINELVISIIQSLIKENRK